MQIEGKNEIQKGSSIPVQEEKINILEYLRYSQICWDPIKKYVIKADATILTKQSLISCVRVSICVFQLNK